MDWNENEMGWGGAGFVLWIAHGLTWPCFPYTVLDLLIIRHYICTARANKVIKLSLIVIYWYKVLQQSIKATNNAINILQRIMYVSYVSFGWVQFGLMTPHFPTSDVNRECFISFLQAQKPHPPPRVQYIKVWNEEFKIWNSKHWIRMWYYNFILKKILNAQREKWSGQFYIRKIHTAYIFMRDDRYFNAENNPIAIFNFKNRHLILLRL